MMRYVRVVISLLMLAGTAWVVTRQTNWSLVGDAFVKVPPQIFFMVIASLIIGALLATLRLQWIAKQLGYDLSFRDTMAGFAYGQLMGVIFFQLAGQLLARSAILSRRQVPPSATIVITGYERLAAFAISLLLASVAAIYLFGAISLDYHQGGSSLIRIAAGIILAVTAGAVFVWGRPLLWQIPPITASTARGLASNALVSLCIQLSTMAAYVLLTHALAPSISVGKLAAASALVMLAASLPISMAGWGVREMSAIYVLGTLGVSADVSFMVAFSIGILSIASVAVLALAGIKDVVAPAKPHQEFIPSIDYAALLDAALPVAAATAVFFQLFLPVNSGVISVNLADPIVITAGCIFAYNHFRQHPPRWRIPHFNLMICLASAVVAAGYLYGYSRFGWNQWAFANKLIGWPILLCYGATAALIVLRFGNAGFDLLLRTFVMTSLVIFAFDYALSVAYWSGATFLREIVSSPLAGFSQNRNAFSFQLQLSLCILLATRWPHKALWLGATIAGIVITGSRAGYLTLATIIVVSMLIASVNWRQLLIAAVLATIIVTVGDLVPALMHLEVASESSSYLTRMISSELSDAERFKSLLGGWRLFLAAPIFGAGLGAFMEDKIRQGTPLVIHSTPLWLLAEFGLVGFVIMAAPVVLILRTELLRARDLDVAGRLLILTITAFAAMSLVHDLLYQRTLWILLGAAMAVQYDRKNAAR